jgi:hypothetical protein
VFKNIKRIIYGFFAFFATSLVVFSFYSLEKSSWIVYSSDSENIVLDNLQDNKNKESIKYYSDNLYIPKGITKITNDTPLIMLVNGRERIIEKGELQILKVSDRFEMEFEESLQLKNVSNPKSLELSKSKNNEESIIQFKNWSSENKIEFTNDNRPFVLYFYNYNHDKILVDDELIDDIGIAIYPINNFQSTINKDPIQPIILGFEGINLSFKSRLSSDFDFQNDNSQISFSNIPNESSTLTMFTIEEQKSYELPKTSLHGSGEIDVEIFIKNNKFTVDIVGEVDELKAANRSLLPSLKKFIGENLSAIVITFLSGIIAAIFSLLTERISPKKEK